MHPGTLRHSAALLCNVRSHGLTHALSTRLSVIQVRRTSDTMSVPDADIFPYATGDAALTVKEHSSPQDLVFWAGWVSSFPLQHTQVQDH